MSEIKSLKDGKSRIVIDNFGGYHFRRPPHTKQPLNEFPVMDNFYMDKTNDRLIKRTGFSRFVESKFRDDVPVENLYEYVNTDGDRYLVAKTNEGATGRLGQALIGSFEPASVNPYLASWDTFSSSEKAGKLDMLTFKNKLYIANRDNGNDPNTVWNGTDYLEMGCPPCKTNKITSIVSSAATGGLAEDSSYSYIVTFLYDNFMEGGAIGGVTGIARSGTTSVGHNALLISGLPTGNARVTARKIYRSKAADPTTFYYAGIVGDNTTTTYLDIVSDEELGDLVPYESFNDLKKPYRSIYQTEHKGRLFQGNLQDGLFESPEGFTLTAVTDGSGGLTTGLYKYKIYKLWVGSVAGATDFLGAKIYGLPTTLIVSVAGANNAVDITYTGSEDPWWNLVAIERTAVNGEDYRDVGLTPADPINYPTVRDSIPDSARSSLGYLGLGSEQAIYPSTVSWSDSGKPDLFSNLRILSDGNQSVNANSINIGQDDGQRIVGIFSELNRVVVFKDRSIHSLSTNLNSPNFWTANVIRSDIGANKGDILQYADNRYFFATTDTTYANNNIVKFFTWDGQNAIYEVSTKIESLLTDEGLLSVYDMAYDAKKEWIYITMRNERTERNYVLIYDTSIRDEKQAGMWYVWYNSVANFGARALALTKDYGVIFGTEWGSAHWQEHDKLTDEIADEATFVSESITTKLQSKTFDFNDTDFDIAKFHLTVGAGSGDIEIIDFYYKLDDAAEVLIPSISPTISANQTRRFHKSLSGTASRFYFRIENSDDTQYQILSLALDIIPRFETGGGK